jgi:hypothetical protein
VESKAHTGKNLTDLLSNYASNFVIDLDEVWQERDYQNNGYLDKENTLIFLSKIKNFIAPYRASNFDEE